MIASAKSLVLVIMFTPLLWYSAPSFLFPLFDNPSLFVPSSHVRSSPTPTRLRRERSRGLAASLPCCAAPTNLFEDLGGGFVFAVLVVPIPPLVRRCLRIVLRRVLPLFLAPESSNVEIVPSVPHLFVTAVVDKVGAEHAVAFTYERVRAVPLIHAEVLVEVVRGRVPRNDLPLHSRL